MASPQATLFTNCFVWQWDNLTPYFPDDNANYSPADGAFQNGSFTVDHETNTFMNFYPQNSVDLTEEMIQEMKVVDLNGQYVLPGFHDGHIHVGHMAMSRSNANLDGIYSMTEIAEALTRHRDLYPNQKWIVGRGFEHQKFTDQPNVLPTRQQLDAIFSDLPIVLIRRCGHIWCCNTIAMILAGVHPENPENWTIPLKLKNQMTFDSNGQATGIVTEDSNIVIYDAMASQNASLHESLIYEFRYLAANGLVAVQNNDRAAEYIYPTMQREGNLAIRSFHTVYFEELRNWLSILYTKMNPNEPLPTLEQLVEFSATCPKDEILQIDNYGNYFKRPTRTTLLSCDRVKLFADGSLGGKTAALRIPYLPTIEDEVVGALATPTLNEGNGSSNYTSSDNTSQNFNNSTTHGNLANSEDGHHHVCKCQHYGMLRETPGTLHDKLTIIKNCGLRAEVHAIGDAAAELIIRGLIRAEMTGPEHRPVLTHCQFLGEDLIEMMHENGVIGNIQPSFLPSDILIMHRYIDPQLYPWAYVWKMMARKGIVCAGGSDSPVEHVNPLTGIYDSMYRPHIHYKTQNMLMADSYMKEMYNDVVFNQMPLTLDNVPTDAPEPYLPSECMTFAEALQMYTANCGYSAMCNEHLEDVRHGSIENGYMADFIVFDRDISQDSYRTILEANIMQTWVNGRKTFDLASTKTYARYQSIKNKQY